MYICVCVYALVYSIDNIRHAHQVRSQACGSSRYIPGVDHQFDTQRSIRVWQKTSRVYHPTGTRYECMECIVCVVSRFLRTRALNRADCWDTSTHRYVNIWSEMYCVCGILLLPRDWRNLPDRSRHRYVNIVVFYCYLVAGETFPDRSRHRYYSEH